MTGKHPQKRVLWAEDNEDIFKRVRQLLEEHLKSVGVGAVIDRAVDGNEVFRLMLGQRYDLLVLDLEMPHYNGIETIRELAKRWPGIRLLVVSRKIDEALYHDALRRLQKEGVVHGAFDTTNEKGWCEAIVFHMQHGDSAPPGVKLHRTLTRHKGTILSVAWSPDGERLATGCTNCEIRLWSGQTGHVDRILRGHSGGVCKVAWSPGGQRLASASTDRSVRIWSLGAADQPMVLSGHSAQVNTVAWSPDGKQLLSASADRALRFWDTTTGACAIVERARPLVGAWWSPDGNLLALLEQVDPLIHLCDPISGTEIRSLAGHSDPVLALAWSADGHQIATGAADRTIRLWEAQDGRQVRVFSGHTDKVTAVAFCTVPGRDLLASKSRDKTVRLWHLETAETAAVLTEAPGPAKWPTEIAFRPQRLELTTLGDKDRVVRQWDLCVSEMIVSPAEAADADTSKGRPREAEEARTIRVLHLSDLHMRPDADPMALLQPLMADLRDPTGGLCIRALDYVLVSGDLTNCASAQEFEKARELIARLLELFHVPSEQCIVVPGNHDLDWEERVYQWRGRRREDTKGLLDGTYVIQEKVLGIRDDKCYPNRFSSFSKHLYEPIFHRHYPTSIESQGVSLFFPKTGIQVLALNSSWEIDEFFPGRSSIHHGALGRLLIEADEQVDQARRAGQLGHLRRPLRIAVFHHPVTGNEKVKDDSFLTRLGQADVKLCLHGHVHEERADVVHYTDPRHIHVVGAGSFGAPARQRPESTPRLYNLLEIAADHSLVRVHTRHQRKGGSAWTGWPVWQSSLNEYRTYYEIDLSSPAAPVVVGKLAKPTL